VAHNGVAAFLSHGIRKRPSQHAELSPVVRPRPCKTVFHGLVAGDGIGRDAGDAGLVNSTKQGRAGRGVDWRKDDHVRVFVDSLVRLLGLQVHVPIAVEHLRLDPIGPGYDVKTAHVGRPVGVIARFEQNDAFARRAVSRRLGHGLLVRLPSRKLDVPPMPLVRFGQGFGVCGALRDDFGLAVWRKQVRLSVGAAKREDVRHGIGVAAAGGERALLRYNLDRKRGVLEVHGRDRGNRHYRGKRHANKGKTILPVHPRISFLNVRLQAAFKYGTLSNFFQQIGALSLEKFITVNRVRFVQHHKGQDQPINENLHFESKTVAANAIEQCVQHEHREITLEHASFAARHQGSANNYSRQYGHQGARTQHGCRRHRTQARGEKRAPQRRAKTAQAETGHQVPITVQTGKPGRFRIGAHQKEVPAAACPVQKC